LSIDHFTKEANEATKNENTKTDFFLKNRLLNNFTG